MAKQILTNCGIYMGGYEISNDINSVAIDADVDVVDVTGFGSDSREYLPGFKGVRIAASGFYNPARGDLALTNEISQSSTLISVVTDNTYGSVAFFSRNVFGTYKPFSAAVGQAGLFEFQAQTTTPPFVRGALLFRGADILGTSNGMPVEAGAIGSTQTGYVGLHVFSASGTTPSLTVKIVSDDNSGFTSQTERLAFSAATEISSQWGSISGPVTDTYWRVDWVISGTSPSFGFSVVFGVV